jgi:hypothetical protein
MAVTSRTIKGYGAHVGYHDRCFVQAGNQPFSPLTEESLEWLRQHGGAQWRQEYNRMWDRTSSDEVGVTFYFDDAATALLFKLTWGGK